jgi:hypothetical protein
MLSTLDRASRYAQPRRRFGIARSAPNVKAMTSRCPIFTPMLPPILTLKPPLLGSAAENLARLALAPHDRVAALEQRERLFDQPQVIELHAVSRLAERLKPCRIDEVTDSRMPLTAKSVSSHCICRLVGVFAAGTIGPQLAGRIDQSFP